MSKKQVTKQDKVYTLIAFGFIAFGYVGFRYVTQAGQGVGVVQNDGYAMLGGIMILIAGIALGYIYGKRGKW